MKSKVFLILVIVALVTLSCAQEVNPEVVSVMDTYAVTVQQDNLDRVEESILVATEDYSGKGYSACTVSSQCMVGEEKCLPGVVPNTQVEPGYCVPQQEVVVQLDPLSVSLWVTEMTLGDNAFDQWQCEKVSQDGKKCLDGKNSPVVLTYPSIYGSPSPSIHLNSYDLGDIDEGMFGLTIERQSLATNYGRCVVAEVDYQEVWFAGQGQIFNSQLQITVCFDKGIWYFKQQVQ